MCFFSTSVYIFVANHRLIFEGTYGSMVVYAIFLLAYRVYTIDRASLSLFILALFLYGTAFVFWITDRLHCEHLT